MSDPILPLASGGFFRITPIREVIVSDPPYLLEPSLDIEMTGPRVLIYGKKRVTLASEAVRTRQASDSRRNESGRRLRQASASPRRKYCRISTLRWERLSTSRPPTKSRARAGGGRFSCRRSCNCQVSGPIPHLHSP